MITAAKKRRQQKELSPTLEAILDAIKICSSSSVEITLDKNTIADNFEEDIKFLREELGFMVLVEGINNTYLTISW